MNIFSIIKNSARKSLSAYKFIIAMWLIMLGIIFLTAFPLKAEFNSIFGKSMLKDALLGGFDPEVFADMGPRALPFLVHCVSAFYLLLFSGMIMYSFFAGGFFASFTSEHDKFKVSDYFKSSALYFFPFLGIAAIIFIMIVLWLLLSFLLPIKISGANGDHMELLVMMIKIFGLISFLGLPVLLLVADHSRRWMTTTGSRKVFKALGAGFRSAFTGFLPSYCIILIIQIISVSLSFVTIKYIADTVPEKGIMIFLFFILAQVLTLAKLWAKTWRYAAVTEMCTAPAEG